jgi:hypothetical protein
MKLDNAAFEQDIIGNVDRTGCHINYVSAKEGDPDFAYSVGFWKSVGQPEVIVFGLGHSLLPSMINETLRQCREGLQLRDGVVVSGLLNNHDVVVRAVHPGHIEREYLNSAIWFHDTHGGQNELEAVQLVWPGAADGLFPWDDGCNQRVRDLQPALYAPEFDA